MLSCTVYFPFSCRVGRGNLVLRHFIHQFPPNSEGILYIFLFSGLKLIKSSPIPIEDVLKQSNRIVNGFAVDISQVPYHAAVRRKTNSGWVYTCGSSIITARALLTAAHCVKM